MNSNNEIENEASVLSNQCIKLKKKGIDLSCSRVSYIGRHASVFIGYYTVAVRR